MTVEIDRGPVLPQWTLADRLRKVRREIAQMGQKEFADILQVSPQAYAHWESGRTTPRNLVVIAQRVEMATRVPAAWMLGVSGPPPDGPWGQPGPNAGKSSCLSSAGQRPALRLVRFAHAA